MRGQRAKIEKPKNAQKAFFLLFSNLLPYRAQLLITLFLVLATGLISLATPYFIKIAIDDFILKKDFEGLKNLSVIFFAVIVLQLVFSYLRSVEMVRISQSVLKDLRVRIFSHVQKLIFDVLDKMRKGDVLSRISNDVENVNNFLSQGFSEILSNTVFVTGTVLAMFWISWRLALLALSTIPVIFIVTFIVAKLSRKIFRENQAVAGEMSSFLEENFSGIKTIKSFGKENEYIEKFEKINQRARKIEFRSELISLILPPTLHALGAASIGIIILGGSILVINGGATIGALAGIIAYTRRFFQPFRAMAELYNHMQSALASSERIGEILCREKENYSDELIKTESSDGSIEFREVDFSYTGDIDVLKDINLTIESGKTVALVGPTGAGKTTVVKLISRFYDPVRGKIEFGGKRIDKISLESYRKNFSVVLQEPFIFSRSVKDNIKYGRHDASFEEVEKAAQTAGIKDFIESLPEKYETVISEDSTNISAGQRQLISIARAILSDRNILILDEATSNVDTWTEKTIQETVSKISTMKTSIVIAHRLSTIKNADYILVIDKNRIIERGTHKELMYKKGYYYDMYVSGL
ncbi:ABC transporter ATP-binding protein [candidate division WOR-3 bacterium]|nr:ABC transporter ATP-binding protein [candidate division WOR-3 bacterium]